MYNKVDKKIIEMYSQGYSVGAISEYIFQNYSCITTCSVVGYVYNVILKKCLV